MVSNEAQRVYDYVKEKLGLELMVRHNFTLARYEDLIRTITAKGVFSSAEAGDIIIKMFKAQWENLKV